MHPVRYIEVEASEACRTAVNTFSVSFAILKKKKGAYKFTFCLLRVSLLISLSSQW
jgi:hypothetical protein